jgi:transposase-like protein
VLRAYARREPEIDRMILASFVLGLSTRKVGEALLPILGERISAATVSRVAKVLDQAVAGFHARPLKGVYRQLVLDGVVLARKTGAGAIRRPVLVALGIRADGRKEVIERFLTDLHRRGLDGEGLEMICVDGGQGLLAALPTVYPGIAVQRCWAHKIRNVLNKVRKADQPAVKRGLHAVMNAKDQPRARAAARHFAERWSEPYPKASTASAMTSTSSSPASATGPFPSAGSSAPPTPSSAASARSGAGPDPWACSRTKPAWTASSSPSSQTKPQPRRQCPLPPDTNLLTSPGET